MLTADEILQVIDANRETLQGFGVKRLALFGSAARGELTESSDLDFLVEFEEKTFAAYMDCKFWLEDEFGLPVDLVTFDGLRPEIRMHVFQEAVSAPGF